MSGVNKVILLGFTGKDPELRYLPNGTAVCNFSLATSETWKDSDGEKKDRTEWHSLVAFGKLAEICGEYLSKGSKIYIEGKIQTRQWDDKDGNKRYTTEIVAREMKMLSPKGGSDQQTSYREEPPMPEPPTMGEDVPF